MHLKHGNRWCDIAKEVEGRTDNAIKNRYNSNLSKRLHEEMFASLFKDDSKPVRVEQDSIPKDKVVDDVL